MVEHSRRQKKQMKSVVPLTIVICAAVLLVNSCSAPTPLSNTPKISLNDVFYKDIDGGQDSLVLLLDFEDGNGDIGLDATQTFHPYHEYDAIWSFDGTLVTIGDQDPLLPFLASTPPFFYNPLPDELEFSLFSDTDVRTEYNCQDYEIVYVSSAQTSFIPLEVGDNVDLDPNEFSIDTILVRRNQDRYNIFVDFFRKVGTEYEFIDWRSAFDSNGCGFDFNARFPVFDHDNIGSSLEGTIKYTMRSAGFNIILRQDVFKLRIWIQDQALNDSNVIETEDLTLGDLLRAD